MNINQSIHSSISRATLRIQICHFPYISYRASNKIWPRVRKLSALYTYPVIWTEWIRIAPVSGSVIKMINELLTDQRWWQSSIKKLRTRKILTSFACLEILKAISAVCDAFCASVFAVSKQFNPFSISSRVLFIFVSKLSPEEYDAEKRCSTWQERKESPPF